MARPFESFFVFGFKTICSLGRAREVKYFLAGKEWISLVLSNNARSPFGSLLQAMLGFTNVCSIF